jgi:capsular polysaccharide biosynthesis protein
MLLLTPFLTVLRAADTGAVIHAPLWPSPAGSRDIDLDLPTDLTAPMRVAGFPGMTAAPAGLGRLIALSRDGRDLCTHPLQRNAFLRDHEAGRFGLLPITPDQAGLLRDLLSQQWTRPDAPEAAAFTIHPREGFQLDLGAAQVDLVHAMPSRGPDPGSVLLPTDQGLVTAIMAGPARDEIRLQRRRPHWRPPAVPNLAALHAESDARLAAAADIEVLTPPITVCEADRLWMFQKPYSGIDHRTGNHRCQPDIMRERDKYVLMARHTEGIIFDPCGVANEDGYLHFLGSGGLRHLPMPAGMRCEGDRLFVDRAALDAAPRLHGPYIVFTTPNLSHYTHWLIDNLLPLSILLDHAPPDARLLLPATLRGFASNPTRICDHHDILRCVGFGDLPVTEIAEPYCHVEDVIWLDRGFIEFIPAASLLAFRARFMRRRDPPARRDRRLYIARRGTRRVANAAQIELFLTKRGFSIHTLDEYTIDQQIDLFSQAEWVVAPHGAELGNLLFCSPGTKVLELSPDVDFKPYFSYMSNKLALTHGVLPCATQDGGFNAEMTVDMEKFAALFRMLRHRL